MSAPPAARAPKFAVSSTVTVLVGSKAGEVAVVESTSWSERDQCHYFYLTQPDRKLSRGYRDEELAAGVVAPPAPAAT